jgi:hypothetical protein
MRGGAHKSEAKKLAPGVKFIDRNIKAGFPPNTFLVVDTHSDEYTGMLQHTGGHTGGTNTTITEILLAYLGEGFVKNMKRSSDAARSDRTVKKTLNGSTPWCDLTPSARGGCRGLFMVSCGPAIRVSHHFDAVKSLVQECVFCCLHVKLSLTAFILYSYFYSDIVDFVLAFGGSGTLPSTVSSTVRSLIMDTGVFGRTDIWSSLCEMVASSNDFLDYTTAVVIYACTVDNRRVVECRQIGKDIPGTRAFGYEFKSCPTPGCCPAPADMRVHNQNVKVHLRCLKCKWRSACARTDEDNKHFKRLNKLAAPQLFWHHFPPSTDLQNYFVELTKAEKAQPGPSQRGEGKKGKKSKSGAEVTIDIQSNSASSAGDSDQ